MVFLARVDHAACGRSHRAAHRSADGRRRLASPRPAASIGCGDESRAGAPGDRCDSTGSSRRTESAERGRAAHSKPAAQILRVGLGIREPRRIAGAPPEYPTFARNSRVQGVVILEAVINERGAIERVKVLKSVPLLDAAAIAAVKEWRYTPTLLNGVPISVLMTITMNFTLQD